MEASRAAGKATHGIACVACLLGVLIAGVLLWGALIWVAQWALPTTFN